MKFLEYDKENVADPTALARRLVASKGNQEQCLICTDVFDLEDGDEPKFKKALAAIEVEFEGLVKRMSAEFGAPVFAGRADKKGFPDWAGLGHMAACWKQKDRLLYLTNTHVGSIAPLTLNIGIVKGPPKNWLAGT